jgi:hypothetical protein
MQSADVEYLMQKGYWVSVAPTTSKGKWAWSCGVYKRGKKTGNWITEDCKTHKSPILAFQWGTNRVIELIKIVEEQETAKLYIDSSERNYK